MNIRNSSILAFIKKILTSASEYKFTSFFALLFSFASIILVYGDFNKDSNWYIYLSNITLSSMLGFFLTLTAYFSKKRNTLIAISIVLSCLYFFSLPFISDYSTIMVNTKHCILIIIAIILLLYTPFHGSKGENHKYLNWAINIMESFIISLLFGVILYLSLLSAVIAIKELFNLEIGYKYTQYLAIVVFGIFCTHYFLLSLSKKPNSSEINLILYNKIGNFFSKYILTTIVGVYSLILIGYIIKILIFKEWPSGIVVWLSLIFATFLLITYIFWTPYTNKYKKILIIIGLIQLPLLFMAIYMRIIQYSWSSNRYMIVMIALWLLCSFLYILIYKKYRYDHIFLSLALLLFISQYGYKINSYYVNDISQLNRLQNLLSSNSKLSNKTDIKLRCDISSSINSLYINRNIAFLDIVLPGIYDKYSLTKDKNEYISFQSLATQELGFDYLSKWPCSYKNATNNIYIINNNPRTKIDISQYDIMYKNISLQEKHFYDDNIQSIPTIIYQNDTYKIKIYTENSHSLDEFDISEFIKKFEESNPNTFSIKSDNEDMTYIAENQNIKIEILFYSINIDNQGEIIYLNADLMIKYLQ